MTYSGLEKKHNFFFFKNALKNKKNIILKKLREMQHLLFYLFLRQFNHGQDKSAQLIIYKRVKEKKGGNSKKERKKEYESERNNICTILGYGASYVE